VGIALAQGIAVGLDRPLVGVGSLRAMARALGADDERIRVPTLDARRGELFVAGYLPGGDAVFPPSAFAREEAGALVRHLVGDRHAVAVGEGAPLLGGGIEIVERDDLGLPHASYVALLGAEATPGQSPVEPDYVRGPGVTLPNLPPSPLDR
jgi:tRNA threonylcarbamoyladenosine biosynthesis protein TsaB